jgi:hypothetical protein
MPRKQPFPPEPDTQPDMRRPSGPASKGKRARAEVATVPPPKSKRSKPTDTKTSGIRSRKPPPISSSKSDASDGKGGKGAKVDEVTADLSKDPRRDSDDE